MPRKKRASKPRKKATKKPPKKGTPGAPKREIDLAAVVAMAANGAPLVAIAKRFGVDRQTLANRRKEDPEFDRALTQAMAEGTGEYESDLFAEWGRKIRKGCIPIIRDAMANWLAQHGEPPREKDWLYQIGPMEDGSYLLVPPNTDPLEAVNRHL